MRMLTHFACISCTNVCLHTSWPACLPAASSACMEQSGQSEEAQFVASLASSLRLEDDDDDDDDARGNNDDEDDVNRRRRRRVSGIVLRSVASGLYCRPRRSDGIMVCNRRRASRSCVLQVQTQGEPTTHWSC